MARRARVTPRFLVRKGPRFYWQPPKYLRQLGLEPERLPDDPTAAWARAEILNARTDQVRAGRQRPLEIAPGPETGTGAWLIHKWAGDITDGNTPGASPEWRRLAERTRHDYRRHLVALREIFGSHLITSLTPRVVFAYRNKLSDPNTGLMPRQNRYRLQVLQALLAYAVQIGELPSNPASKMRLVSNPPRRAFWTDADVERFLAADPPPSIRLALMLGLWTGQRQADVLSLRWSDISAHGWITLEQRKSRRAGRAAKRVAVPISHALAAELVRVDRRGVQVVLSESTKRPYRPDHFQARVARGHQASRPRRAPVPRSAPVGCGALGRGRMRGGRDRQLDRALDRRYQDDPGYVLRADPEGRLGCPGQT